MDELSMQEIEDERAVALPNKEVLSLLDVNANVDLGLDLAAPVDLAAAANLNVAAPIEASAAANLLSPDAQAVGLAEQHGTLEQNLSGTATATAPQHAGVTQNSMGTQISGGTAATGAEPASGATGDVAHPATPVDATASPQSTSPAEPGVAAADPAAGTSGTTAAEPSGTGTTALDGATNNLGSAVDGAASGLGSAVDGAASSPAAENLANAAGTAAGSTSGGIDSLLNGGSLLDANVNIHADANLTAPIDGAVAANGNVAAPIDAAVGANVGSPGAVAEALAPQQVDIVQNLDHVSADATATQDANVAQQ